MNSGMPVFSANAIQISGTNTPSISRHIIFIAPILSYLPLLKFRKEIHFESTGEFRCRSKGKTHIAREHFGDVGARDFHSLRKLAIIDTKLLHPAKYPPQKRRCNMVYCLHSTLFTHQSKRQITPCFAPSSRKLGCRPQNIQNLIFKINSTFVHLNLHRIYQLFLILYFKF